MINRKKNLQHESSNFIPIQVNRPGSTKIDPFPLKAEKLHNTALISNAGPMAFGLGGFRGHKTASEVKSEDVLSKEVSKRSCDTVKIVQLDEV